MGHKQPVVNREERVLDPSGTEHWLLSTKVPMLDEAGHVIGVIGVGRDITARRRLEQGLLAENSAYKEENQILEEQRRSDAALIARLRDEARKPG
jgi:hypothetical protein